ncbi:MAG: hypothetical protein IH614_19750 [Desulfuromonadales bacterium]|nr:hypothetical protein [Desulfuromonadales bacterium]
MIPASVCRYLATRAVSGPWSLAGERRDFSAAVVIPALAEGRNLPATLASLAANPAQLLADLLVVVVVNHRADAAASDRADNLTTLQRLAAGELSAGLNLQWIDAASSGRQLPPGQGVGLARKIGLDLALSRLNWRRSPLLVSLDADTLVDADYLPALLAHFRQATAGGALIPFRHRPGNNPAEETAIVRYELFLRHYVLGLALASSPYAFHSVGSAFACRAEAYAGAGGMNRRRAGEDFYFLQQLAKTCGVAPLPGTTVLPSPRASHRVPFGTGRSVSRLLAGETDAVQFYHPHCFQLVGDWLQLAADHLSNPAAELISRTEALSADLGAYLRQQEFATVWPRLQRNNPQPTARLRAFHGWFDGLKTLRLIHHLSAGAFPRCEPLPAVHPLLRQAGIEPAADLPGLLGQLRRLQG